MKQKLEQLLNGYDLTKKNSSRVTFFLSLRQKNEIKMLKHPMIFKKIYILQWTSDFVYLTIQKYKINLTIFDT